MLGTKTESLPKVSFDYSEGGKPIKFNDPYHQRFGGHQAL